MAERTIPIVLPLDSDGFLRRECPGCERQFKWFPAPDHAEPPVVSDQTEDVFYCPYCHEAVEPGGWLTREQIEYARQVAISELLGSGAALRQTGEPPAPGGYVQTEVPIPISRPAPLTEADDLLRVDFPCHPDEPLKIQETWTGPVACLICGQRHPLTQLRPS